MEGNDVLPIDEARQTGGAMLPVEQEVARGMRFMHLMVMATQRQGNETTRLVEELCKLLIAKGIASDAEWREALRIQDQNCGEL